MNILEYKIVNYLLQVTYFIIACALFMLVHPVITISLAYLSYNVAFIIIVSICYGHGHIGCSATTGHVVLAYLNCHVYIQFVIVFTIVGRFVAYSDLLVCLWQTVG